MGIRISKATTEEEILAYVDSPFTTFDLSSLPSHRFVYQFTSNQGGTWTVLTKFWSREDLLKQWKGLVNDQFRFKSAVMLDRRLAFIIQGKAYLLSLATFGTVPAWLSEDEPNTRVKPDEPGYVHVMG